MTNPVAFKVQQVPELSRGLVKVLLDFNPRVSYSVGFGWSLRICISNTVPSDFDACWPRDSALRGTELGLRTNLVTCTLQTFTLCKELHQDHLSNWCFRKITNHHKSQILELLILSQFKIHKYQHSTDLYLPFQSWVPHWKLAFVPFIGVTCFFIQVPGQHCN